MAQNDATLKKKERISEYDKKKITKKVEKYENITELKNKNTPQQGGIVRV